MPQTPREVMLATFAHRQPDRTPYQFWYDGAVADKLDTHYGHGDWREWPERFFATHLTVDTLQERRVSTTHAVDGFGALWRMDRLPWHLETPPLAEPTLQGYAFPPHAQFLSPIRESAPAAIEKIRAEPDMFHIIAMGWGLFEQTWRLRGFENMLSDVILEESFYCALMERLSDLYIAMVDACAGVPADAFLFGDDWGEQRGVIIGPERWRRLVKPYWRRVYDRVHAQGKLAISHSCGSVAKILPDLIDIGLDGLESVQPEAAGMDPYELKRAYGSSITFFGCLGTQRLLPFGAPDEIRAEVRRLKAHMGQNGGFILSPAKPLQPETPAENAVALLEALVEG